MTTTFGKRLRAVFPATVWASQYGLPKLKLDLLAGLTVGVMAVPQSMSYATVAGLPAVYGLCEC